MSSDPAKPVRLLPFSFAKHFGVAATEQKNGKMIVLCRDSIPVSPILEVRRFVGMPIILEVIPATKFDTILQHVYESRADDAIQIADDLGEDLDLQSIANQLPEPDDLLESKDDAPIIRLINGLVTEAVKKNASDIHMEPFEHRLRVRFRIDGVLRDVLQPPAVLAPYLVSRIKVMAKLDIAEKRLPQDGRISLKIAGRAVDVRVSTIPSGHGERVVLRLLDKQTGRLDLEQLGMAPATLSKMDELIQQPNGIILVTGPTGSGKTTTLYAAITRLNSQSRNIMTVEDPIEYFLDGIGQTQVNTKVKMTFARGLRAILRQDPDVIMIGEIRDLETAEIAVQASLTGHLVFSTLHTNSAVGAITRLRDMGIEPFLLASTLTAVLAQRLVRILCTSCRTTLQPDPTECRFLAMPTENSPQIFSARGCDACNFTGYNGRTGIYELIEIKEQVRTMIHDGNSEHEIEALVRTWSPNIKQDGLRRIKAGETTIDEVVRVVQEETQTTDK